MRLWGFYDLDRMDETEIAHGESFLLDLHKGHVVNCVFEKSDSVVFGAYRDFADSLAVVYALDVGGGRFLVGVSLCHVSILVEHEGGDDESKNFRDFLGAVFRLENVIVLEGDSLFEAWGFSVNDKMKKEGKEFYHNLETKLFKDYLVPEYRDIFDDPLSLIAEKMFKSKGKRRVFDVVKGLACISFVYLVKSKYVGFTADIDVIESLKESFVSEDIDFRCDAFHDCDFVKLEALGAGSYGSVFACFHKEYNEIFAVKEYNRDESGLVSFKRELNLVGCIRHPAVVFDDSAASWLL